MNKKYSLKYRLNEGFWEDALGGNRITKVEDVKTLGDLLAVLKYATSKKKEKQGKDVLKGAIKDAVVGEIMGKIPGLTAAKSVYDGIKLMYELPDEKRTGTALDYMDIDDNVSAIVDDNEENGFIKAWVKHLSDMSKEELSQEIESVDMTDLLNDYLANKYGGHKVKT